MAKHIEFWHGIYKEPFTKFQHYLYLVWKVLCHQSGSWYSKYFTLCKKKPIQLWTMWKGIYTEFFFCSIQELLLGKRHLCQYCEKTITRSPALKRLAQKAHNMILALCVFSVASLMSPKWKLVNTKYFTLCKKNNTVGNNVERHLHRIFL